MSLKDDLSIIYCNINEFDINNKRLQRFCLKTYTNKTFPVITLELEKILSDVSCFVTCNYISFACGGILNEAQNYYE